MAEGILAGVKVGGNHPVRIMGVINVSPESFFKGSVHITGGSLAAAARRIESDGADFIDIGAMSTAPYLKTEISEQEEARRLSAAVAAVRKSSRLPISADTSRFLPAQAALNAGARILNDVTGFRRDPRLPSLARKFNGLILMAHPSGLRKKSRDPIGAAMMLLRESLQIARRARVPARQMAIDPGIGFFRDNGLPWWEWDLAQLRDLGRLSKLNAPVLVGVSRKSFVGKLTGEKNPENRLAGSLAATTAAVLNGAAIIRTHDVKETIEAVRVAEKLRGSC